MIFPGHAGLVLPVLLSRWYSGGLACRVKIFLWLQTLPEHAVLVFSTFKDVDMLAHEGEKTKLAHWQWVATLVLGNPGLHPTRPLT